MQRSRLWLHSLHAQPTDVISVRMTSTVRQVSDDLALGSWSAGPSAASTAVCVDVTEIRSPTVVRTACLRARMPCKWRALTHKQGATSAAAKQRCCSMIAMSVRCAHTFGQQRLQACR